MHSARTPHESLFLYNRSLYLFNRVTGIEISLTYCDSDKHVTFRIRRDHDEFILLKYFLTHRVNTMHQTIAEIVGDF